MIFTSLGCLENVLGQRVLVNMCEQQRVCQSPAQLLKPSTSPLQKYRMLPASFFYDFLRSLLLLGWRWDAGDPSSLEPWALLWSLALTGFMRVPPSLVPTPHPKKQSNFYFIMSNRNYINHVEQGLFSGTELVFNSAVNKDFQL